MVAASSPFLADLIADSNHDKLILDGVKPDQVFLGLEAQTHSGVYIMANQKNLSPPLKIFEILLLLKLFYTGKQNRDIFALFTPFLILYYLFPELFSFFLPFFPLFFLFSSPFLPFLPFYPILPSKFFPAL